MSVGRKATNRVAINWEAAGCGSLFRVKLSGGGWYVLRPHSHLCVDDRLQVDTNGDGEFLLTFDYTEINLGLEAAAGGGVLGWENTLAVDGRVRYTVRQRGPLASNQSVHETMRVSVGRWDGEAHNLTLQLDANDDVREAYEDNNITPVHFSFCQWAPPPPPPPPLPPPSPPPPPPPPCVPRTRPVADATFGWIRERDDTRSASWDEHGPCGLG
jgi:hypothetical protein